ncbi:MAG TPA: primosomal protein N' [Candidatus Acidoferrales bacterium]|nr:primosomal protein N' [Candidatus Acidoferrales bacterium]
MTPRYCEVALPVPLRTTFTYAIPENLNSAELVGSRVVVPFRNRPMVGVVVRVGVQPPAGKKTKEIAELLDAIPALPPKLIELGLWVSRYYVAPIGETLRALLPPLAELRQDREYKITVQGRKLLEGLQERGPVEAGESTDLAILELLSRQNKSVKTARIRRLTGGEAAAERLVRLGCVEARDCIHRTHERVQKIFSWNPSAVAQDETEERLHGLLTSERGPLPLTVLLEEKIAQAVAAKLEKKGKLISWEEPLSQEEDKWEADFIPPSNVLNSEQERAVASVCEWLEKRAFNVGLLHGVTGSGKTEVYLAAIGAALAQGRTAIVLVPEIALTLWMSRLVRARFGGIVAVLHSGLSDNERAREWWRVRRGESKVVVGTRSAVFSPLENLGLVIVDEEQESSYKQEESPRYNGRDTAIFRARLEGAVALLGSATPSLESYHNAQSGKYHLLELTTRVENRPLAAVRLVDLREEFKHFRHASPVSSTVLKAIARQFEKNTQAMVLINRRGYSWYVLCRSCGSGIECRNCSIALAYHKRRARLECHYCGFSSAVPRICPKCKSEYLYFVGDAAERVAEFLREQFPKARIGRLDRDTVRTKREYQKILGAFARRELDLLVGTQMVAKGHDFERVTLVGVISADMALGRPDFRAAERTFQLLTQVAGRAGRGSLPGEVLIETYYPEHYAIQHVLSQDYSAFYKREIHFRRMMHYPPFIALANVLVRDRKIENAIRWSRALASYFNSRQFPELKVLGPAAAALSRLRNEHRFQILLKTPNRKLLAGLLDGCLRFCAAKEIPESAVIVDVDPASLF